MKSKESNLNDERKKWEMLYLCCTQTKKPLKFEWFLDCKFAVEKVRAGRLELPHLAASDPKSDVSTNSTTPAFSIF